MKGIALAMETIVYMILAVLVLAVLLYFLTSQVAPVENRTKWLQESAKYCSMYTTADRTCTKVESGALSTTASIGEEGSRQIKVSDLVSVCGKLGNLGCTRGGNKQMQECIQRCCLTCLTKPS